MSDTVIKIENLGKKYRISHKQPQKYLALRDILVDRAKRLGKRLIRPFGASNASFQSVEDFWALKDVSFDVKQGERVGIIGRNGAGKSTLLKILSRITEPSAGRVSIKGRVASLLEIGTGFHPELTGRENIFLNGAILGMSKAEIKKNFDAIVDFAGVEQFLDTPVKHYSSGMYVRLAFAVAAHLDTEILLVDEVLAVGDAEFQKKCMGKMDEVSHKEGRTILFVSHNMGAIRRLCGRALLLKQGRLFLDDGVDTVISNYLETSHKKENTIQIPEDPTKSINILGIKISNANNSYAEIFDIFDEIRISITFKVLTPVRGTIIYLWLKKFETNVFLATDTDDFPADFSMRSPGVFETTAIIPPGKLSVGEYYVDIGSAFHYREYIQQFQDCLSFKIYSSEDRMTQSRATEGFVMTSPVNWIRRT